MAYERSESARDNLGKFIHQFQRETKALIRKLERIFIKLYRQNVSLLFNQTCLNERVRMDLGVTAIKKYWKFSRNGASPSDAVYCHMQDTHCGDRSVQNISFTVKLPYNIIIIIIIAPPARISLTLSRHFSLSFIAPGRSSGLHPVSSHSCCM